MQRKLFDLTNPQKSIWYTEEVFKGTPIENITGTCIVLEKVDFKLLEKSLNLFVQKNDGFRLNFILENGNVKQFVSEFTSFNVDKVLVSSESELKALEKELTNIPFNTIDSLLFNFKMFEFPDGHGGFVVVMHHLISDAWTSGLLVSQIMDLYADLVKLGSTSDDISPSYIDYVESENKYLNSEKFKNDEKFWNDMFSSVPEVATFPSFKNDTNSLSCKAKRKQFVIPKSTMELINEFCKNHKVSAFNFFMGVLALYLGRVSNLDEFVIGTPILNRSNFKEKHTAGMFISVVPFKITINHECKFADFLSKISADFFNIFRHQKYPYQYLLDNLRKQDSSLPHLYNILVSYQNMRSNKQSAEVKYEARWSFNNNISDDMEIHFFDINDTGDIDVAYDYKISKYSKDDIFAIHSRIINIINQVLANEDILLKEIEIVTPDEKNKILYEFNNTKMDYPKDKTIIQLFEEQVEKTPDNIAVVFEDQKLTYRELNEKANSLGNYLLSKHVESNEVIAIFLDKSLEMIVAILGILKAGCIYLPIDINYPDERIEFMLKDSSCRFVLTSKSLSPSINKLLETICIDLLDFEDNFEKVANNIIAPKTKESLAYIMYTSGSTGNPKGVIVTHKNIVRLVKNTNYIKFQKEERILQTGSIVFDACTFEIWGALLNGFELYIIKKQDLLDPYLLKQYLINNKITILWLTAPLFNQLCENNPDMFKTVRVLLTGGDVLSPKHINLVKNACPNLTIINGYGPTENTTFSTCFTINDTYEDAIPIGFPIANSTCYVVSSNSNLLPVNVPGELLVGGDGVGKGYLNNPEYTKEKFIKNPFGEGILYKTGDLVKWRNDGSIDFIGRIDNQVKIRGFRVELNEINLKIHDFSSIKDCTTIVKNINNEKVICSYFSADKVVDINDLKNFLKQSLPHYAIPTYLMQLDSLPINANGKIDVKKLPVPKIEVHNKDIILPKNDTEIELIKIIKELLNINEISMNDNFFELGGDSLSAINLCAQIQNKFTVQLFVKDILEHPIIAEISKILSSKQASTNSGIIKPAQKKEYYPVSSAQKRMYLSSTVSGENSILYNIPGGIILDKTIDVEKLEKCLNALIKRHDVLRTHFELNDGNVIQKIEKNIKFKLQTSEEIISSSNLKQEFNNFVQPFDLAKTSLFRAKYIKLDNNKSALFVDMHHIISDGTSLSIFIDELCKLYNGETLPELSLTYKDFAVWENDKLSSGEFKEAEDFWVNQFKDEIPVLNMPTNYSRPSVKSYEGNKIYSKLDKLTIEKINTICKEFRITPYMLLLSIYYILLSKYTDQDDIVVGSPIVGRNISELYNIIGMFVNSLPMRAKIDSNLSFKDFVNTVKTMCLENYKHQDYPFDELVNKLNISKDTGRNPLFDTMFIYQNNGNPAVNLGKINSEYYIPDTRISKFDLSLEIIPENNYLNMSFEYCTKLFDKSFIENLSNHYSNILNIVLENLDIKLCDIDMLSEDEKNKILYEFNNTKMDYPKDKAIVELFEEQVEKTPDNIAVVFEDQKLTYRELNEKANSLGNYLRKNNIGRNDIVGVMTSRSLEMLVSILAVLKAGGTYIPIDPTYPKDRIEYMLSNSKAKFVLTQEKLRSNINFKNIINVDLKNENIYSLNKTNLKNINEPDDSSYIIYTSGSTGLPKGVVLTHKALSNLTNYCNNYIEYLKNNSYRTVVSITTVSFDIFIFETLISLQKGLKLIIANENEQTIPRLLNDLIKKNNIEIIQSTPSRMQLLVNNIQDIPELKNLDFITLAGEQLPLRLVQALKKISGATIYNGYGPSETTVFSTLTEMDDKIITIGKPLDNTQIYILDKNLKPVPLGIAGELYISGEGVGKGYLNNKELTSKSFISNPFINNTIMYKTGDLGRYTPEGNIICLGRSDNQVKIRGLRIELGEIEKKFLENSSITSCVVVKKVDETSSHEFLCAYYTSKNSIDEKVIRVHLQKSLPNYMVPQYFCKLQELPYTPNGKIDTKKLPMPKIGTNNKNIILPQNEVENKLVNILKDLLNINEISMDDTFFELGGDSLSAINLCTQIHSEFNVQLFVKDILEHPVISEISDILSNKQEVTNIQIIKPAQEMEYYPVSSAQKRMYLASTVSGENSILYNIPGGIILNYLPDIKKLEKSLNILINRHESLRTYFTLENDTVVQKIQDKIRFKLEVDKNIILENNIKNAYDEFVKPFDLKVAPLFRAKLVCLENNKSALFVDMHHIISDGTSLSIFIDELCKLYNGETLPELSLSYKDFAVWENDQLASGKLKEAEEFWVNQFKDDIPVLNMPTNYSRPSVQSFEGTTISAELGLETKTKIENIAKDLGVTPYMLMLSVYYVLLSKYTSQDTIVVGSPIVGRDFADTYNLIGMFVNTIALKNKIDTKSSFKDFLNTVKQNCLNAYKYQTYPFDELVSKLNIKRNTSRSPLFDTMFTYQNNGNPSINLGDINTTYYIPNNNISKFDFSLEVVPNGNGLHLNFEYCTKLFKDDFMINMLNHFINILNTVLEKNDIKISDIDMLSEDEKSKLLNEFNDTKVNYPKDKTIVKLFEEQVEKTPNDIAIVYKKEKLTYLELNKKVNSLANYLKSMDIGKNNIVPVLLNRSDKLIISMLAIMKTGAAYLPVSTEYPLDRINYIISNSNAKVVITDHSNTLINNDLLKIVFIDDYDFSKNSHKNLDLNISVNDLLYVIYTSGSTGNPKGVKIAHSNLTNFIYSFTNYFEGIFNKDRCLATTNISFDVSIWEFFISLLNGATLFLYEENTINDIFEYCKYIIDKKISLLYIPPNILEEVYNILSSYKNIPIQKILLGVEPIKSSVIKKYYKLNKDMKIVNAYGPTETTICATANILNLETISNYPIIPIGKPLHNLDAFVLDKSLNLVPIGVPGELYICGSGVGRGYLNNKELTDKSFVELPKFSSKKAYKTGDLVKWNSDGNISFIGREDFQLKINGHRIELGEIESCISQYPDIDKAVVLADKSNKLIAYFTSSKTIATNDLKAFMQMKLPNYLIPNFFVQLDAFKLTQNGKIDRKALSRIKVDFSVEYEVPRTDYEKKLVKLFEKVLGIEKIGITDNFFDIGGDSLSAIKLQIEAFNEGLNLAYKDIFKYPTIKQLSNQISSNNDKEITTENNYDYAKINELIAKNKSTNMFNILRKDNIKNILLTGATGFIGSHILDNLIKNTRSNIYCLIRAKDNTDPQTRLLNILRFYFGNTYDKQIFKRIFIIEGDITDSNLGLSDYYYEELGQNIDCVINSAAIVKHYGNSEIFNNTNIAGTQNIIDFCNKFNCKLVHISTTSVSGNIFETNEYKVADLEKGTVFAENSLYIGQDLSNIYIYTKFIAERLILENIIQNNLNAKIIRIGNITNRYSDGAFQLNVTENAFTNRIRSFLQIGCVPDYLLDGYLEFTPVDSCADAIVKLAIYKNPFTIFHAYNNNHITLKTLIKTLNDLKVKLDIVPADIFNRIIKRFLKDETTKNSLSGIINDFDENKKLVYNTNIKIKNDFTNNYLKKIYFKWPKIGEKYLNKYIIYLKSIGYIK